MITDKIQRLDIAFEGECLETGQADVMRFARNVEFAELPHIGERLILGCLDLADLGFQLKTENDKARLTLRNLGIEMDATLVPKTRAADYQLRVTETLNVTVPVVVNVPLSFPRAAREKGWWIQSTPHEGIKVVEQPLSKISHDDADQSTHVMGSATVLVEPGATLDVDTLEGAWAV